MLEVDILFRSARRPEGEWWPHLIVERGNARLHHAHAERASKPFGSRGERCHPVDAKTALVEFEKISGIGRVRDNEIATSDFGVSDDRGLQRCPVIGVTADRLEEQTSEFQSLMSISHADLCLTNKQQDLIKH